MWPFSQLGSRWSQQNLHGKIIWSFSHSVRSRHSMWKCVALKNSANSDFMSMMLCYMCLIIHDLSYPLSDYEGQFSFVPPIICVFLHFTKSASFILIVQILHSVTLFPTSGPQQLDLCLPPHCCCLFHSSAATCRRCIWLSFIEKKAKMYNL